MCNDWSVDFPDRIVALFLVFLSYSSDVFSFFLRIAMSALSWFICIFSAEGMLWEDQNYFDTEAFFSSLNYGF